jgi:hypothetical protein
LDLQTGKNIVPAFETILSHGVNIPDDHAVIPAKAGILIYTRIIERLESFSLNSETEYRNSIKKTDTIF